MTLLLEHFPDDILELCRGLVAGKAFVGLPRIPFQFWFDSAGPATRHVTVEQLPAESVQLERLPDLDFIKK